MPSNYETASFAEMIGAREQEGADQNALAPYEHRAFAREWTADSPLVASASLPFAIPAYTAAKAAGFTSARSEASFEEMKQGYIGLYEGLVQAFKGK